MPFFNPLFIFMYLSSFFIVLGGESWFLLWVGLEINMISFIMLVYGKSIMNIEVCMKYFFVQGLGSALLLLIMTLSSNFLKEAVLLILSYKMGAGPFFFWFPAFCEGVSWGSCVLVMSLQKVIPLLFMSMFVCSFIWFILLLSMMVGVMGCFNEIKLKKFMAFSSIHYIGWMILCIEMNSYLWVIYLAGYLLMLLGVLMSVEFNEFFLLKDVVKNSGLFIFSMFNMGGMPPMLGFFLKWWVFLMILSFKVEIVAIILVLAVTMFYTYMRLVYPIMMDYMYLNTFFMQKMLYNNNNNKNKEWLYIFSVMISPLLGWIFI